MKKITFNRNKLRRIISIAMLCFLTINLHAQAPVITSNAAGGNDYTFTVSTPGNLKIALTALKSTISFTSGQKDNFIISGTLNTDDINYFASNIGGWTANSWNLNKLDLSGATVSALHDEQFDGTKNYSIKEIILPNTLTILPFKTFAGCTSITRGAGVTTIGQQCYSWARWTTLGTFDANSLFPNLTTLNQQAFAYQDNGADFTGIILPASFTTFGSDVFSTCPKLATVILNATTPPAYNYLGNRDAWKWDGGGWVIDAAVPITLYVPVGSLAAYQANSGYVNYFGLANIKENPFPTPIVSFGVPMPFYKSSGDGPFTATASSNSDGAFTYASNNESVATVNSSTGEVTIHSPGLALITVNQAASGPFNAGSASYTLTVRQKITISDNQTASAIGSFAPDVVVSQTGKLTIDANSTIHDVIIQPGGCVTLNNGISLSINSMSLNCDASGTGTYVDKNVVGPTINGKVKQTLANGRNWYLSSPVTSFSLNEFWPMNDSISYWNESLGSWQYVTGANYWDALTVGKGYISLNNKNNYTNNINFSGTLNNNQIVVPLTCKGSTYTGFNLVGNPYPSYLDWSLVSAANADISTTVWFRTKTNANVYTFSTVNALGNIAVANDANTTISKFIPPMQAFWVKMNAGKTDVNLTFTNAMRSHAEVSSNLLKVRAGQNEVQKSLRLQVSNGVNLDEAVIYTNENAKNGFDKYDSQKRSNGNVLIPEIYSLVDGEHLVINGLAEVPNDTEIPLGFYTGQANSFRIMASEIENIDGSIILKDKQTKSEQDLSVNKEYVFSSEATTTNNRFSIIFKTRGSSSEQESTLNDELSVYCDAENRIVVKFNSKFDTPYTVSVFNMCGQLFMQKMLTQNQTTFEKALTTGVYLVAVNGVTKKMVKRIVIKN